MAPGSRRRGFPASVPALTAGLALAAVVGGLIAGALATPARPPLWAWAVLAVALVAAAALQVEFRSGAEVDAVDLFEAGLAPVIFLVGGLEAVGLAAGAKAVVEVAQRIPPVKATFNVAQWAAATAAGGLVLGLLVGTDRGPTALVALVPAMLVVATVNHVAFVAVLRLVGGGTVRGVLAVLRPVLVAAWGAGGALNLVVGLLFAAAASWAPGTAALFPVLLVALHLASRGYAATLAERARFEALQRASHELLATGDLDDALPRFLGEVRHCAGAQAAELVVTIGGEHRVHRVDGGGASTRPLSATDADLVAAVLSAPEPLAGARGDGRSHPALAAALAALDHGEGAATPVRFGDGVAAALCVYDRAGLRREGDGERALLDALAGELAQALHRRDLLVALGGSEARFRALVQRSSDVVSVVDADGVVRYLSPSAGPWLGLSESDAVGRPVTELLHPDDLDRWAAALEDVRPAVGTSTTLVLRLPVGAPAWRLFETVVTNLVDDPAVRGYVLNSRDVSERKRDEILLAGQARTLEVIARDPPLSEVLESVGAVVAAHSPGARVGVVVRHRGDELAAGPARPLVDALLAALQVGAWRPGRVAMRSQHARRSLLVPDLLADPVWAGVAEGAITAGVRAAWAVPLLVRGEVAGVVVVLSPVPGDPDPSQRRLLDLSAHLIDIALDRSRAHAQLVARATRDELTGLANRVLFQDRLQLAMARAARRGSLVAVLLVDLDRFTLVNDSFGRAAGDQVLVTLAARLTGLLRPGDTVARSAGDEFAMLLEELVDVGDAVVVAEAVAGAIAAPVLVGGREVMVTASVGIALADGPSLRPETLIDNADAASYRAKAKGGGGWEVFEERMRAASLHRLATHSGLHHALQRHELRVVYQPVISLPAGRVVGVEALVRWQHPSRGLVAPAEFIGSAEETGLIIPIGLHVLREATAQAEGWRRAGRDLTVAVNLSARQFGDPGLVPGVADALEVSGIDPAAVVLEITETVLMDDADRTLRALEDLKALGVQLAVDDFGTGYSSLTYLKRFAVDGLKVDRSFVAGMAHDDGDHAIVSAVVGLAHSLGMGAVAEGVETVEQLRLLSDLGCEAGQGYYFSRPFAADELDLDRVAEVAAVRRGGGPPGRAVR